MRRLAIVLISLLALSGSARIVHYSVNWARPSGVTGAAGPIAEINEIMKVEWELYTATSYTNTAYTNTYGDMGQHVGGSQPFFITNGVAWMDQSDFLTNGTFLDAPPANLSWRFWVGLDSDFAARYLTAKANITTEDRLLTHITTNLIGGFTEYNNGGIDAINYLTNTLHYEWYHIVNVWGSDRGYELWINGVLVGNLPAANTVMKNGTSADFGVNREMLFGNAGIQGWYGPWVFWDKSLTPTEITNDYAQVPTEPLWRGRYEDAELLFFDAAVAATGVYANTGYKMNWTALADFTQTNSGSRPNPTNGALTFDGVNDFIEHDTLFDTPVDGLGIAVSVWINPSITNTSIIWGKDNKNVENRLYLYSDTNSVRVFAEYNDEGILVVWPTNVIPTGDWTHVGVNWGPSGLGIVINGVMSTNRPADNHVMKSGTLANFGIGKLIFFDAYPFSGEIDGFRAFGRERSAKDWLEIYGEGRNY